MKKDIYTCSDDIPNLTAEGCSCDYNKIPASIVKVEVRKDEHGNFLVRVNGSGPWLGATYNADKGVIEFSY